MVEQQFGAKFSGFPSNPAQYARDVRVELSRILHSRAGKALADSLHYQFLPTTPGAGGKRGKNIWIQPYLGNDDNAEEDGRSPGSQESVVLFTPKPRPSSRCSRNNAANLPHEMLFHELVHSLRRITGHIGPHAVKGTQLQPYTNTEEFLAILVTNIFISDATNHYKTCLRADHQSHAPLDPELADSFRFFSLGTRAYNVIANFCSDNAGFSRMLSNVPARFNPVAAYYRNPRKAFDMAADGDAKDTFNNLIPMNYYTTPDGVWRRLIPYPGP